MPATIETMEASRAASEVGWPFAHSRAELDAIAAEALQVALRVGATDATIRLLEADNMSVGIRNGNPETLLRSATQRATPTIFNGQRSGSASTSDLSPGALNAAIERAWRIAHYSGEDPFGGPADSSWLEHAPLDLDLYHPRDLSFPDATDLCQRVERAALDFDRLRRRRAERPRIRSDGDAVARIGAEHGGRDGVRDGRKRRHCRRRRTPSE